MTTLEGIKITVGGREWIVPSLTYGEKRRLQAEKRFDLKPNLFDAMDDDAAVALTALRHNYPDAKVEDFDDLSPVELGKLAQAAVYATIGLKEMPGPGAQSPKAEPPGESTSTT